MYYYPPHFRNGETRAQRSWVLGHKIIISGTAGVQTQAAGSAVLAPSSDSASLSRKGAEFAPEPEIPWPSVSWNFSGLYPSDEIQLKTNQARKPRLDQFMLYKYVLSANRNELQIFFASSLLLDTASHSLRLRSESNTSIGDPPGPRAWKARPEWAHYPSLGCWLK